MEILITERADITPLLGMDLFENKRTMKDAEIKINIQPKPDHYPVKQKTRSIPLHLQEDVGRGLQKIIRAGHLEKISLVDENCFLSPVMVTVKNDKSVKIALDFRKQNDSCM